MILAAAAVMLVLVGLVGCGRADMTNKPDSVPPQALSSAPEPAVVPLSGGFAFGPFVDGSDPDLGTDLSATTVLFLMGRLQQRVEWLRTFSAINGLEHVAEFGHDMGFKIAIGAWINADAASNEIELTAVIELAKTGQVDVVMVGSETLLRREVSEADLIAMIERVRNEIPVEVIVTYADVYHEYLRRPGLIAAVDVLCANLYPWWQGIGLDDAMAAVDAWYDALVTVADGKPVWICESGWPSDGSVNGNAIPGLQESVVYLTNFLSWAESRNIRYFYFEAFDEPWKSRLEGDVGNHWGVWDQFGNIKPGMELPLLEGDRVANNWSGDRVIGGPGTAMVEFEKVPAINSFEDLAGRVRHVNPTVHSIAVYIQVSGGWWTKPTFAQPLTVINPDGTWRTDITTGGIDPQATEIAAYLLPIGIIAPLAAGALQLPDELETIAVASAVVVRD